MKCRKWEIRWPIFGWALISILYFAYMEQTQIRIFLFILMNGFFAVRFGVKKREEE